MRYWIAMLTVAIFANFCPGAVLTWTYDPDSGALPHAAGQPFEGGTTSNPQKMSIVDLGGGDMVLEVTSDTAGAPFVQQNANTTPGREWNVSAATGYSVEWRVWLGTTTNFGAADMHVGNGSTRPFFRLARNTASGFAARLQNNATPTNLVEVNLGDLGFDPDAYHTYRIDVTTISGVVNSFLYVDGTQVATTTHTAPETVNWISFPARSSQVGVTRTQFVKTYQAGVVVPEPACLAMIGAAPMLLLGRRRHR